MSSHADEEAEKRDEEDKGSKLNQIVCDLVALTS